MSWFDDQGDVWQPPADQQSPTVYPDNGPAASATTTPGYGQPGMPGGPPLPDTVTNPTPPPATGSGSGTPDYSTDAGILAQIGQWAGMSGADPSLANDPNYWLGRIKQTGGLNAGNLDYWQKASVGPTAFFNNPNRDSGGAPLSTIGTAPPATTFAPPPAPTYTPYVPTAAPTAQQLPTPTPYVAPTADQARQTPGYQFAVDQANLGYQRSALAKGNLLSGQGINDLAALNQNLADTNYSNLVNQGLAINSNNFGQQFNTTQANNANALNQWQSQTNAGLSAAGLNLQGANTQFQNTYLPLWNAYQSDVGQQQFGANYGLNANQQAFGQDLATNQFNLGAQNQYWNQGFNENQNAYNQYDNNQKTAFDQWYKQAQLGNPGNPYA